MLTSRVGAAAALLVGLYLVGSVLLTGCNKTTPSPEADGTDSVAVGKKVFETNNCARCHAVGGSGGAVAGGPGGNPPAPGGGAPGPGGMRGGMKGPDLGKVGADAAHTRQWFAEKVREPKKHKPDSRMPASGPDKINETDLMALADYLGSLK